MAMRLFASSAVDRVFEPRWIKPKTMKLVFVCFSSKHAAIRRNSKYWLDRNQDNGATYLSTDSCISELALYKSI